MEKYQIKIEQKKTLMVTHPDMDDLEISLGGAEVVDSYVVVFEENEVDGEPGYTKTTAINGLIDMVSVKKSQLSKDDKTSSLVMGEPYLYMAILPKSDAAKTEPYYIKLLMKKNNGQSD